MANTDLETGLENVNNVVFCETTKQSQAHYRKWSAQYDSDMDVLGVSYSTKVVDMFEKHVTELDNLKVLDLGGGTGTASFNLRNRLNFKGEIDILDASMSMLYEASQKDVGFRNILCHFVTDSGELPFRDETYDVIISSGAFLPNHIPASSIFGVINALKRGGLLMLTRRLQTNEEYGEEFVENVEKLCKEKKLKFVDRMEYIHFTNIEHKFQSGGFVYQRL
ncbi:ubiquinone/menaquinone biosynthesis C-methyltransferase UbiE-like [Ciona intestinalis]